MRGNGGFTFSSLEVSRLSVSSSRDLFFSAEGGAERVNLAKSHRDGFGIKLAALRQIGFLIVDVIHFEQSGRAFAGGGREHGCVSERVALAVHEFARGANGFGANAENGRLARRSNPQVALIEQEINAVLFELDREGRTLRDFLDDLDFADADFVTTRSTLFRADSACDDDAGFLCQSFERFECF